MNSRRMLYSFALLAGAMSTSRFSYNRMHDGESVKRKKIGIPSSVPLTKNGKWNKDLYYVCQYTGNLKPVKKRELTPVEAKRKEKRKRAKQARKKNQSYARLTKEQIKRRKKAKLKTLNNDKKNKHID